MFQIMKVTLNLLAGVFQRDVCVAVQIPTLSSGVKKVKW